MRERDGEATHDGGCFGLHLVLRHRGGVAVGAVDLFEDTVRTGVIGVLCGID